MNRQETLKSAEACVLKDRQKTHGAPEDSFALIAKFWSAYLGYGIRDYEVGILLGLMKIARMKFSPRHADNYTDLAGYAACSAELATEVDEVFPAPKDVPKQRKSLQQIISDNEAREKKESEQKSFWDGIGSPSPLPADVLNKVESCANL